MADLTEFDNLMDVPFQVEACLNGPVLLVSDVLALRKGSTIVTPHLAGESVTIHAGEAPIGSGELGNTKSRVIVRVTALGSQK